MYRMAPTPDTTLQQYYDSIIPLANSWLLLVFLVNKLLLQMLVMPSGNI